MRTVRTSQPQGATQIDWGNPITRGLVYAWIPSTDTLTKSGPTTLATNTRGVGLATNGTSSYEFSNSSPLFSLDECSVTAILTPSVISAASTYAVSAGNSVSANPLFLIGQGATANNLAFRTRDAANTNIETQGTSSSWADGVTSVVSGTRSKTAALQLVFAAGKQVGSIAVGTASATTFDRFAIGCLLRSSAALFWAGTTNLVIIHNRALSDAEIRSLSDNPWQIFQPVNRSFWNTGAPVVVIRPTSDILTTSWTGTPDNTNLYTNIDDVVSNDTDYILSPLITGGENVIMGLSKSLEIGTWAITYRASFPGLSAQVRVHLLDSSNAVQGVSSWQTLASSVASYTVQITTSGIATRVKIEVQ